MGRTGPEGRPAAEGSGWDGRPVDTQRLRLRQMAVSDETALVRLLDDWEVARTTSTIPFPYDRRAAAGFIAEVERLTTEGAALVFAVEDRLSGSLIGCVGASLDGCAGEVGYWIGHSWWGRGYATEALRRCLSLAFRHCGVDRAWAAVLPENIASRRVAEKAGLILCGRRTMDLPARGLSAELDILELTRSGWDAMRGNRPMVLVVAAALVDGAGRVLLARRPEGKTLAGFWEFPGGKVERGESPEEALVRELREELGIGVAATDLAPITFASHDYDGFHLLMPLYVCRRWQGTPSSREGQALAWTRLDDLGDRPMPPADTPLLALLRDRL